MIGGVLASPASWSADLDGDQLAAVEEQADPLLIVAGAGTGKTRTLVCRLARLIEEGSPPERLLLVTFSRRAAHEMVQRLGSLVGGDVSRRVVAGTFHAVAHRLLSRHAVQLGLGDGFTLIDQGDACDLMALARDEARSSSPPPHGDSPGLSEELDSPGSQAPQVLARTSHRRFPRKETLLAVYSKTVNSQVPLHEALCEHFPWLVDHEPAIAEVFRSYTARKRADCLLDFDDLLVYWRAAAKDRDVGSELARSFDHVFVDEFQDTNLLQADIVYLMHEAGCALTTVGDDAQAIYSFRAATVDNILNFERRFPAGRIVRLERNYRSTQPILDLANAVLAGAEEGYEKRLWTTNALGGRPQLATCPDEATEAAAVADVVVEHHEKGLRLRDQAVLFRTSHHADLLEVELRRRRIPFVKYGGLRFLEAAHVRDLLSALRILDNPADELAWFRLLQLLDGVGPATARRIMRSIGVPGGSSRTPGTPSGDPGVGQRDPISALGALTGQLPRSARREAIDLVAALSDCSSRSLEADPGAQIDRLRDALGPLLRRRYDNCDSRMADLEALGRVASAYGSRTLMTADLTLDPPVSTGDFAGPSHLDDDYLILSTVHSAKGGEWRAVHVIRAADGSFPSDLATGNRRQVEEERRLFYVALTRAKEHLHIYTPLRFHLDQPAGRTDRHSYAQRTRFLPAEVDVLLDHRPVRSETSNISLNGVSCRLHDAVANSLNALW